MGTGKSKGGKPLISLLICFPYQAEKSAKNRQVAHIMRKRWTVRYGFVR